VRFRLGLVMGFGAGYVLGSKAGRERYEQIRNAAEQLWGSEPGRLVRGKAHEVTEQVKSQTLDPLLHRKHLDLTESKAAAAPGTLR